MPRYRRRRAPPIAPPSDNPRAVPEARNRPSDWVRIDATGLDTSLTGRPGAPGVNRARLSVLSLAQYRDCYGVRTDSHGAFEAHGGEWHGGLSSRADVLSMLSGDGERAHDLAARVRELADTLTDELPPLPSRRRRRVWSDDGSDYDFDRLQDFHERPASARKRTVRSDPGTVHLVATFGGSSGTSADQLAWAGAPCLAVARALLDAGYSVSIDATFVTIDLGRAQGIVVKLLESGTSYEADDAALAGVVCCAGTFRTCGFVAHALNEPGLNSSLGFCIANPARIYQAVARTGALPEPTWCFEPSFSSDQALTSARTALRAIVERLDPASVLDERGAHDVAMSS